MIQRFNRPQSKYGSVQSTGSHLVSLWPGDGGPNNTFPSNTLVVNFPVSFEYLTPMSYVNFRMESSASLSQLSGRNKSYQPFVLYDYYHTQKLTLLIVSSSEAYIKLPLVLTLFTLFTQYFHQKLWISMMICKYCISNLPGHNVHK